jgi:hypothetical protein
MWRTKGEDTSIISSWAANDHQQLGKFAQARSALYAGNLFLQSLRWHLVNACATHAAQSEVATESTFPLCFATPGTASSLKKI